MQPFSGQLSNYHNFHCCYALTFWHLSINSKNMNYVQITVVKNEGRRQKINVHEYYTFYITSNFDIYIKFWKVQDFLVNWKCKNPCTLKVQVWDDFLVSKQESNKFETWNVNIQIRVVNCHQFIFGKFLVFLTKLEPLVLHQNQNTWRSWVRRRAADELRRRQSPPRV